MLQTGQAISHFQIVREIGRGGMGIVYEATDLRLDRRVALKVIRPDLPDQSSQSASFDALAREARLAAALSHPSLVTIFSFERTMGQAVIAMEYVPGKSLSERLRDGWHPTCQEIVWLLSEITAGVAAAHRESILHLDLKPANVIVRPDGRVKVLDFGIARSMRQRSVSAAATVGTPAYMAPELFRGEDPTPATDVWSIAAIGIYLATGASPYDGESPADIAAAVVQGPPPRLKDSVKILGPVYPVIENCFATAREKRPRDASELLAMLGGRFNEFAGGTAHATSGREFTPVSSEISLSLSMTDRSTGLRPSRLPLLVGTSATIAILLLVGTGVAYVGSARGSRVVTADPSSAEFAVVTGAEETPSTGGGGATPESATHLFTSAELANAVSTVNRASQPLAPAPITGTVHEVRMIGDASGYRYEPSSITASPGDAIKFIMLSGGPHNVAFNLTTTPSGQEGQLQANMPNSIDGSSPMFIDPGDEWTVSLGNLTPGRYEFECIPHLAMNMRGAIKVQPRIAPTTRVAARAPSEDPEERAEAAQRNEARRKEVVNEVMGRVDQMVKDGNFVEAQSLLRSPLTSDEIVSKRDAIQAQCERQRSILSASGVDLRCRP